MRRHWQSSNGSGRQYAAPSALVRAERIMQGAANLCGLTLTQQAKRYAPLVSRHEVSDLLNRGGCVGKVGVLMLADPMKALRYAEHLHSLARSVVRSDERPLHIVRAEKVRADAAEDVARSELQDNETVETLRRAIAAQEEEVARGQALLDEYRERLAELEAGR
jgi:hypothetical protein